MNGLVNYWPVKNGQMADLIGLVKTTSAGSSRFTPDWFGNANDAILVNSDTSYWTFPGGVYFYGDYTITGSRILDAAPSITL